MKQTNKYIPFSPKEAKKTSPLHVVLTAWFCGCTVGLFFLPQIKAYIHTADDDEIVEVADTLQTPPTTSEQTSSKKTVPLPSPNINETTSSKQHVLPTTIPQRVLLIGSSSMKSDLGALLAQSLRKQELYVYRHAKVGSGLARPDFYNWMEILPDLIAAHTPDLVIVQFIGNDCQSLIMPNGSLKAKYGTEEWDKAYEERLTSLITLLHQQGIRITFLGMSNVQSSVFRKKLKRSNSIIYSVASKHNAPFISLWETTSSTRGSAQQQIVVNSIPKRMYQEDGIHLSRAGARMVAQDVFTQLKQLYDWTLP
ncbi:MAG: hypothetical protein CL916_08550 [Deltaproteobacteria bacterium]|nr:hypothetical protein [Deltaproteobacteria bacterium]